MRQPPSILGGRPVLSLDAAIEKPTAGRETIDLDHVLLDVGFDVDERAFLRANMLDHIPRRSLPTELGWTANQVDAVRMRIRRKLADMKPRNRELYVAGDSLHLSRRERRESGRLEWALSGVGEGFMHVMQKERAKTFLRRNVPIHKV